MRRLAAACIAAASLFAPFGCAVGGGYCSHYDDWAEADRDMRALEARYGTQTADWPASGLRDFRDAVDGRAVAANRMWDAAPAGADWASVRQACR